MKSSSKAFTMIELIFVIVIIGIIASVVMPKMEAKRVEHKAELVKQQNDKTTEWK